MAVTTEQLMELKKKVGAIRGKSLQAQATMVEVENNIKRLNDEPTMALSREELLKRMAKNTVNLYVTFTECSPMIPLESFELGVPCIIGNNTDFFTNSELEELVVVKEEDSIDEIYEKINIAIENKDKIMKLYIEWKKEYIEEVRRLKEEFLND